MTAQTRAVSLLAPGELAPHKVRAERALYQGREALRLTDVLDSFLGNEDRLVVVPGTEFQDGQIELELAGEPGPGAQGAARGFVGVAFHVSPDVSAFEAFYLRPTNGRAEDQVRRNHSVQYISFPDWPWHRSRQETPEKYESYVDLAPGAWTKVCVLIAGERARLYVHGAEQPNLLVNDLKLGPRSGLIGLWIGPGTVAHFIDLRLTPA